MNVETIAIRRTTDRTEMCIENLRTHVRRMSSTIGFPT